MTKRKVFAKSIATLVSFIMAFTILPAASFADTAGGSEEEAAAQREPVSISAEGVTEKDAIEQGTDESMTTFDLGEGKHMTVLYSGQVRYEDEGGTLRDCDPSLVESYSEESITGKSLSGYSFETAAGESKAYLPESFTEDTPLLLEKGDYSISFAPSEEITFSEPSVSKEEFLNGYEEKEMAQTLATYESEDVSLQYESQTDGIKEEIIFKRRPEEDHFDFEMTMDGLRPEMDEEGGILTLDQKSEKTAGFMEAPFMTDDDGAYSEDISYEIRDLKETEEGCTFTLRLDMDPAFLDEAAYPLTVDPSHTWRGNSNLRDVFIKSNSYQNNNYYGSSYMTIRAGKLDSSASYRDLIAFIDLKDVVKGKFVDSAALTLYQKDGNEKNQTVRAYRCTESWKASKVTWANQPAAASYSTATMTTTATEHAPRTMDLTTFVRNVANESVHNYGILLKNNTANTGYAGFYGSRTTASSYRPKLVVTYYAGPAMPTRVYIRGGSMAGAASSMQVNYEGITSHDLDYVQYKIVKFTDSGALSATAAVPYSAATKVQADSADGHFDVSISSLSEGKYRIYVRGIDATGVTGTAGKHDFIIDRTAPHINALTAKDMNGNAITSSAQQPIAPQDIELSWDITEDNIDSIEYRIGNGEYMNAGGNAEGSTYISRYELGDGQNVITLRVKDKAGSTDTAAASVYIDREGTAIDTLSLSPASSMNAPASTDTPVLSWTTQGGEAAVKVEVKTDGGDYVDIGSGTSGTCTFPAYSFIKAGAHQITVRAWDVNGNKGEEKQVTYYMSAKAVSTSAFTPQDLSAREEYGKTVLSWQVQSVLPKGVSFDIYRSDTQGFTPSAQNRIAEGITDTSFTDMDVSDGNARYYRVKVKVDNGGGTPQTALAAGEASCTPPIVSPSTASRTGSAFWLSCYGFDTPSGSGSIEKSSGILSYSQTDFEVSNSGFEYGMTRSYCSGLAITGMLGKGWTDSWHQQLYQDGDDILYMDDAGTVFTFEKTGSEYACTESADLELTETADGYEIMCEEGLITFDSQGRMIRKEDGNENTLDFEYDHQGRLKAVISLADDAAEKRIEADYDSGEVSMTLPDETVMSYSIAQRKLTEAEHASANGSQSVSWEMDYAGDKLDGISDACGNEYRVTYSSGKACRITYPDSSYADMSYGMQSGERTFSAAVKSPAGLLLSEESAALDAASGKLLSETDAAGNETDYRYAYSANPLLVTGTETETEYEYYENGQIKTGTTTVTTSTSYDSEEQVTSDTDEDGETTTYEYIDDDSNPWLDGEIEEEITTDADDAVISDTSFDYDDDGNCILEEEEIEDSVTETEYDDYGNETIEAESEKGVTGSVETMRSTPDGDTYRSSEEAADMNEGELVSYDQMGRVLWEKDPDTGVKTAYSMDFLGRVTSVTSTDSFGTKTTTSTYDDNGSLLSETDEYGAVTSYAYDSMNRKIGRQVAMGNSSYTENTSYGFEPSASLQAGISRASGNLTTQTVTSGSTVLSKTCSDGAGNVVRTESAGMTTDQIYDRSGNCIAERTYSVAQQGPLTAHAFDENGQEICTIRNPQVTSGKFTSGTDSVTSEKEYDLQGNLISETDGKGIETGYGYDNENRLVSITEDKGGSCERTSTVTYSEDAVKDTTSVAEETAGGFQIITESDAAGNTVKETLTDGTLSEETAYSYDSRGNQTNIRFGNGTEEIRSYDSRNRLTEVRWYDGQENEALRSEYTYDSHDNLIRREDYDSERGPDQPLRVARFTYDSFGRMISEAEVTPDDMQDLEDELDDNEIGYSYDVKGQLTGADDLSYSYDAWGKLTSVRLAGLLSKTLREYSYDSLGRISCITTDAKADQVLSSAETDCRYSYDDLGRVSRMSCYTGQSEKERYEYGYDKNDQIIAESVMNVRTADPVSTEKEYTYDRLGQLTGSELTDSIDSSNDRRITYTYDTDGNRTEKTEGNVTTVYAYDGLEHLTEETVTMDPGTSNEEIISQTEYRYDGRGNQISEVDSVTGKSTESVFDAAGRLKTLTSFEGGEEVLLQENRYDGDGKRILREESKTDENDQTEETFLDYHYSNGKVSFTKDENGDELLHNLYSPEGSIIAAEDVSRNDQELYVYTKDIRASTRCLLDEDLACAGMYDYGDFGETEKLQDPAFENQICYTGGIYDENTGLYYLNARFYDPSIGRFISEDTYHGEMEVPDTWHLYAYCANDPMNYVDPSGHLKVKLPKWAPKWAKKRVKMIPKKKKHYKRNKYNKKLPSTASKALAKTGKYHYRECKVYESVCHQFSAGIFPNRKFVSPNGKKEVVFNHKGDTKITDERDKGTYNFAGKNRRKHIWKDIAPWVLWGNSKKDSTTRSQRIDALLYHVPKISYKLIKYLSGRDI